MSVETAVQSSTANDLRTDGQLLAEFVAHSDAEAFTVIVHRYDRLVMGVCRRIVGQTSDVDDAFQATFLVLAKDARRIKRPEALSSWLYGVACRVSLRLVRERHRRHEEVFEDQVMDTNDSVSLLSERYDARVLDEEVNRLPERYRSPMVLHYFMGKSNSQIAKQLNLSVGSIDGRLKRGRARLRVRLAKRGVTMSVLGGLLASARSAQASSQPLIEQTVTAAVEYAGGGVPSGLVCSQQAIQIAGKELFVMTLAKPLMISAAVFAAATIGVSAFAMQNGTDGTNQTQNGSASVADANLPSGPPSKLKTVASDDADPFAPANAFAGSKDDGGAKVKKIPILGDLPVAGAIFQRQSGVVEEEWNPQRAAASAPNPNSKPAGSQTPPGQTFGVASHSVTERKIFKELQQPIEAIDFEQNTLQDLIDFLEDIHALQIQVDGRALEDEGFSEDDFEITAQLSGISMQSALDIILDQHDLAYVVKHDVLYFTTIEAAQEDLETRVYKVNEVMESTSDIIELVTAVESAIDGEWEDEGGNGTISVIGTGPGARLVIRQTQKAHREIESLFGQLRESISKDTQNVSGSNPFLDPMFQNESSETAKTSGEFASTTIDVASLFPGETVQPEQVKTYAALVRSPLIADDVIKQQSNSAAIRSQPDPRKWLLENLSVQRNGSKLIVSLPGAKKLMQPLVNEVAMAVRRKVATLREDTNKEAMSLILKAKRDLETELKDVTDRLAAFRRQKKSDAGYLAQEAALETELKRKQALVRALEDRIDEISRKTSASGHRSGASPMHENSRSETHEELRPVLSKRRKS